MKERLFHLKDIVEVYGLSLYEARTIMSKIQKINVGRGEQRPRWVVRQSDIDAYLNRKTQKDANPGLDTLGRILRRR